MSRSLVVWGRALVATARLGRPAVLTVLLVLMTPWADGQEQVPRSFSDKVLVEQVTWPVFVTGRCRSLTPDQILVTEDRQACRVTAFDDERHARIHAILVDNSASVGPHFQKIKDGILEYLDTIPRDDPVIVGSFANNVLLEAGLSTDREDQVEAVRGMPLGQHTALRDAIYYMMRYLEQRPERKVLILSTDTFGNASLGRHDDDQLLAMARRIPDLAVFVIQLRKLTQQIPNAEPLLRRLTSETRGDYFLVRERNRFIHAFRVIRERLDAELFISYEPPAFGEGPLDHAAERSHRSRIVEVHASRGLRCEVSSAGPATRLAGQAAPRVETGRRTDPGENPASVTLANDCPAGPPFEVTDGLRFPFPPTWPGRERNASYLYLPASPTRLLGRTVDILAEPGARYDANLLFREGLYQLERETSLVLGVRDFTVELPPLDLVRQRIRSPVDLLEFLMERGSCANAGTARRPAQRHPLLVHGQTWLELRRPLAEALYRWREDYRAWAREKLGDRRRKRLDDLLRTYRERVPMSDAEFERLREALFSGAPRAGPELAHTVLTEWLGDVTVRDAALGLEKRIANRLLDDADPDRRTALEDFWASLHGWFPPPVHARVLTPLVPVYDPRRDVIGFYRVVVARVRDGGPPLDPLPERPFAVRLLVRLLDAPGPAAALRGGAKVTSIRSTPLWPTREVRSKGSRRRPSASPQRPHEALETSIDLIAPNGEPFSLSGIHVRSSTPGSDEFDLECLRLERATTARGPSITDALTRFIEDSKLICDRKLIRRYAPAS